MGAGPAHVVLVDTVPVGQAPHSEFSIHATGAAFGHADALLRDLGPDVPHRFRQVFVSAGRNGIQRREPVGTDHDPGARGAAQQRGRRLDDVGVDAAISQSEARGQPAQPSAGDEDVGARGRRAREDPLVQRDGQRGRGGVQGRRRGETLYGPEEGRRQEEGTPTPSHRHRGFGFGGSGCERGTILPKNTSSSGRHIVQLEITRSTRI